MKQRIILTAPEAERIMHIFDRPYYQHEYGQNIRNYMKKIRTAVKIFHQGEDEYVHLFFSAPRGNIEDWADYEEMKYLNEEDTDGKPYTREEFEEEWKSEFPYETMYYSFSFSAYKDAAGISLGRRCYIETREDVEYDYDYTEINRFFEWILDQITRCAEKIKAGAYEEEIYTHIPYTMRTGTIARKTLWKLDSDYRQWDQDELTQAEIDRFAEYMKDNRKIYMEGMTSGMYFEFCKIGYEANHEDFTGFSAKEMYLKMADGRDDGLSEIRENSPEDLILWGKGDLQHFNGHHPWEIFRGGNSTHVDFGIEMDRNDPKKACLYIAGYHRQKETVRMYNALRESGVPVYVYNAEDLLERITGMGRVGIVPNGVFPRYCESWFPDEHIRSFINVYSSDQNYMEIVKNTKWQSLEYSRLLIQ